MLRHQALPEALIGDSWTSKTARTALPLLVWCAENEKRITYGALDAEIQRRGWGHHVHPAMYGYPAGAIGNALLEMEENIGEKIPPLNALVVNAITGVPGCGCDYYLSTYLNDVPRKRLNEEQRKAMGLETIDEVWRYKKWRQLLSRYGITALSGGIPSLSSGAPLRSPKKSGWSNEPESEAHKALKKWVAKNPHVLKAKVRFSQGKQEWLFASADRVDVMFEHKNCSLAVEVKANNANDADLERGIYQCVKYQALLRAELKAGGKVPHGSAALITERVLPFKLQRLADILGIRVINVPKEGER